MEQKSDGIQEFSALLKVCSDARIRQFYEEAKARGPRFEAFAQACKDAAIQRGFLLQN